jgi:hypothetical protein
LRNDPEEQLPQLLRSEIWDAWSKLDPENNPAYRSTNQKQVAGVLGPEFEKFLRADPGQEFPLEQLVTWARMLNQAVPNVPETQAVPTPASRVPIYGPETTKITDNFFAERTRLFPNYFALQQGYYATPPSDRALYRQRFPQLGAYEKWRDTQYHLYPQLKKILNSEAFSTVDTSKWPPMLEEMVQSAAMTGDRLPPGARSMLEQVWIREGKPRDTFQSWLTGVVYPAMLNKMNWQMAP